MMATRVEELQPLPGEGERVLRGVADTRWRLLPFLGPAFIACVAYVDPGNFATNIAGGSKFGFTLVWVIGVCYLGELWFAHPPLGTVARHAVVPEFAGNESILLAVGILGATVMPHVIYLHSALTQRRIVPRNDDEARKLYRYTRIDVLIAMAPAGLINIAMLVVAATVFFGSGLTHVPSLDGAHRTLQPI